MCESVYSHWIFFCRLCIGPKLWIFVSSFAYVRYMICSWSNKNIHEKTNLWNEQRKKKRWQASGFNVILRPIMHTVNISTMTTTTTQMTRHSFLQTQHTHIIRCHPIAVLHWFIIKFLLIAFLNECFPLCTRCPDIILGRGLRETNVRNAWIFCHMQRKRARARRNNAIFHINISLCFLFSCFCLFLKLKKKRKKKNY